MLQKQIKVENMKKAVIKGQVMNEEILRRKLQNRKFLTDEIAIEDDSQDRRIEQRHLERVKPKCAVCGHRDADVTSMDIINEEIYVCLLCLNLYSAKIKRKLV